MHKRFRRKKKILATVLRLCFLAFVAIVLGVNVYLWNARSLVGSAMPMPFGVGSAVVLSGSMEPALQVDDLILVCEKAEYEVDDIVVFQDGHSLTVHRLIALDGDRVITKGDANNVADDPITPDRIIGAVFLRIPFLGLIARILKTPVGIVCLLAAALLLVEVSYRNEKKEGSEQVEQLKDEIRRLRQEREEKAEGGETPK